jgi:hypothetical protein
VSAFAVKHEDMIRLAVIADLYRKHAVVMITDEGPDVKYYDRVLTNCAVMNDLKLACLKNPHAVDVAGELHELPADVLSMDYDPVRDALVVLAKDGVHVVYDASSGGKEELVESHPWRDVKGSISVTEPGTAFAVVSNIYKCSTEAEVVVVRY